MPIYEYTHSESLGENCAQTFERVHGINERLEVCPVCSNPVHKLVSSFSHRSSVLATSNVKEKGFRRFRRKDKGVYEED
jgi:predicted nucleic acid-binding Zn ribbon protein